MKPTHDALELADRASTLLKSAGFQLRYVSMQSEACYYGWPGMSEVIRVATHPQKHSERININGNRVVAKITMRGTHLVRRGEMNMREDKLQSVVAIAIGTYFLRAAGIKPW